MTARTPEVWTEVELQSVCAKITVGHVGPMADQYVRQGVTFLRSQNVKPFRVDLKDVKYITAEFNAKLRKSELRPGDVVVVRTGYPGTAAVIPPNLRVANCADLVILRPSPEIDPWFLASIFNSVWGQGVVSGQLVGAAQQHFNVGSAKRLKVPIPRIEVQQRIASILSAYDSLIENNARRIAILEEMARRLYDEWFVAFRFPGHGDRKFVETDLGLAPVDWRIIRCDEAISFNPRTKVPKEGHKLFVPMSALSETQMTLGGLERKDGNSGAKFQNDDTLLARITPCLENGKTGFVNVLPDDQPTACGSTEFIVMRSKTVSPEFVYLLARSDRFRDVAMKSMSGATGRQRVRTEVLEELPIAQPDQATVRRFADAVQPVFSLVRTLDRQRINLRAQRDLLLPKLISGEINVSTIEKPTVQPEAA